jgi:integrase
MSNQMTMQESGAKKVYQWRDLQDLVSPAILSAPRLDWSAVERRHVHYLIRTIHAEEAVWFEHLTLLTAVLASYIGLDAATVHQHIMYLHGRWRQLFPLYGLTTVADWQPEEHLPRYFNDQAFSDSLNTRQDFLQTYTADAEYSQAYLKALPRAERDIYLPWSLPAFSRREARKISRRPEIVEAQKQQRKLETDALTPHLPKIRGEAHLRWNELKRLRSKFGEALALIEAGQKTVPLAFSYEEPRYGQRFHFMVWDRPHFVLAHRQHYQDTAFFRAKKQLRQRDSKPFFYFLEFVGASPLTHPETSAACDGDGPLWFGDLLRYGLLRDGPFRGEPEELQRQRSYLESWGYVSEDEDMACAPFRTCYSGLLTSPRAAALFLGEAHRLTQKVVFQVEPLFAAATLGLAALELLTSTGMRINEVLQVSIQPECLHTLVVEEVKRLVLRLVPKGSDKLADYFVGPETQRTFEKVVQFLQDHYQLPPGGRLPSVPFDPNNGRAHLFPERPYLFQLNKRHISDWALTACMRFLCHGLVFQARDGRAVPLKAHSLRHVFATHAHHVEHLPLDVVAVILHQKNLQVTGYYAAPQWEQVVAATDLLLDPFATHLGSVEEVMVRTPAELQQQYESARSQAGTLTRVIGGECTCHALCPVSFACTGCVYKVPDPARRDELLEQRQWALIRLEQVKARRMGPEAVKMQVLIQRCNAELEEMNLIEQYRKDENYEPALDLEHDA